MDTLRVDIVPGVDTGETDVDVVPIFVHSFFVLFLA